MNMKNEILKLKSDYEYVSQSENDIIFVNNTFINVYHVLTNKMQRINKVHVKNVCIDMKDNYLFLSTFESGCLSIYDLKEGTFLTKKTILRNYEIENISPMNDDVVILLKNKIEMKIVLNTKRIHNSVNGEIKSTAFFITIKELPQIRADINSIHLPNISFFIYSLTYNLVNNNTVRFIFHYKIVFKKKRMYLSIHPVICYSATR